MAFENLSEFFAMGGHALYVWLAYGATWGVLLTLVLGSRAAQRRQLTLLGAQHRREAARAAATTDPIAGDLS